MRDQREEQLRWDREDEDRRRQSEGRMHYDYGHSSERQGGREEERGSFREEGHSRWQGGGWQGEYPGREDDRRDVQSGRGEYRSISRDEYLDRGERDSGRWSEPGSGWRQSDSGRSEQSVGRFDQGRSEIQGGRQEQGRWGIGSERSGDGRMSWEDRGRARSTDSGEYRGIESRGGESRSSEFRGSDSRSGESRGSESRGSDSRGSERRDSEYRGVQGGYEERGREQGRGSERRREEYRSDRDSGGRESLRGQSSGRSGSGHDNSGTWRQFDSWGDTSYGDSRGQGYGTHRRDSYSSDFLSQGERGRDHDR